MDNEPPAFRNCPAHPIVVEKGPNGFLLPVNFTQPVAVDNSGSIARTTIKPEGFSLPLTTFEDMMIEYFAYDYDGNVAICQVNLTVPDDKLTEAKAEAETMEKLEITKLDLQWLQVSVI